MSDYLLEKSLLLLSSAIVSFWVVIWVMHICALVNAKLKLNKTTQHHNNNLQIHVKPPPSSPPTPPPSPKHHHHHQQQQHTSTRTNNQSAPQNGTNKNIHHTYHHSDNSYVNLPLPGVSIIKPLVGVDTNLYANLETFFCMDYPLYELLFCVQDPDDAAILTVKSLFKLYPEVDAKLFTGGSCVGVNPKINNMQPAYEAAKYELLLVSDSGISMKRDTLLDMVYHMHEDVALVHQMPFVCDNKGTGFDSVVEKVYFGTAHARAYLTADLLNINCPTGMSALMRKHLLDEVGGIKAFGQYLAEDFFFAKSFTDRGWRISISSQPAWQNTANTGNTISTLNGRIQRWIKLRFAMVPHWTFLEPFSECLLLGFLGAISISFLWALDPLAIFTIHLVIWLAFDYTLLRTIQNGPLTFSISQFLLAWLVRESTALPTFAKALANRNKVTWRSRIFRLKSGGFAEEIMPDKQNVIFYLYLSPPPSNNHNKSTPTPTLSTTSTTITTTTDTISITT